MPQNVSIDTISMTKGGNLQGTGPVAQRLLASGFNINALRTNGVLRKDEWIQLDQKLIGIARRKLVAVQELMRRNLTYTIRNGLGTTVLEWERVSDMEPAHVSMSGITQGQNDTLEYDLQSMPLPIIHKDFNINIRKLEASRASGNSLDTAQAVMCSRLVSEAIETMFFTGNTAARVGSSRIYGILNHPDINTGSITASWDVAGTTGTQKLTDVLAMINKLNDDHMYGPYGIFVTNTAFTLLAADHKDNGDKSQLTRLMETPNLEFILPSRDMVAGTVTMVQLTEDVIDEVIGLQPTIVQWDTNGGMTVNFKVMAIMVPRVRSTQSGQSGVVKLA